MKISECCAARPYSNGDVDTEDLGICPDCKEHCEYLDVCEECWEVDCVCPDEHDQAIEETMIFNDREKNTNG